jgi:hypothetical protein
MNWAMNSLRNTARAAILIALLSSLAAAVPWMYAPTNQHGSLGNNYDEFQNYGGAPYYHDGIDVMSGAGGVHVYSVSDGWMTHETAGTMYGGLMIGDQYVAGGTGWLYWHLPNSTYPFNVGDHINVGDYIGDVATWSVSNFHHTHFNRVVGTGGLPWNWYASIENPLDLLDPNAEPQAPTIYNATGQNLLAFCVNNTSTYLNPASLSGDVDIIAKIGDRIWNNQWEVIPYRMAYTIAGGSITDTRQAFVFNGLLPASTTVLGVVYKDDATCNTEGNYNLRNFFFVLTNNDGDSLIEDSDNAGMWHTAGYPAGQYTLSVQAWDRGGNTTQSSMNVTVAAAPTYNVSIDLTPTSSLVLPASGGSFTYDVNIHNNESSTVTFDGWIDMTYPSGLVNTVILRNIVLSAGGTVLRSLTQTVAGSEPNGTYSYTGKVGYHPYNPWASDGFTFTKGLDGFDIGTWIERTEVSGWENDQMLPAVVVAAAPDQARMMAAHPNPFNPSTTLSFDLPTANQVKLRVYDTTGRLAAELINGWREAGTHEVTFDASHLSSGIYLARISAGSFQAVHKIMLVK